MGLLSPLRTVKCYCQNLRKDTSQEQGYLGSSRGNYGEWLSTDWIGYERQGILLEETKNRKKTWGERILDDQRRSLYETIHSYSSSGNYFMALDWECCYCRSLRPSTEYTCLNCGAPRVREE